MSEPHTFEWPGKPRLLADWEIRQACIEHGLVTLQGEGEHSGLNRQIRHCSYELTTSNRVEILMADGDTTGFRDHQVEADGFWIPPMGTVRVFCREVLDLPKFVFAQCVGLGQIFAAGVIVGSTYVDPGSKGAIYLAMTNVGSRSIRIPLEKPLARAFFTVLAEVDRPHPGAGSRRRISFLLGPERSAVTGADSVDVSQRLRVLTVLMVALLVGSALLAVGLAVVGFMWPLWLLLPVTASWASLWTAEKSWTWVGGRGAHDTLVRARRWLGGVLLASVIGVAASLVAQSL
jgi:deoxycytidine triphosphate deaminase